jgi:DNA-binding response OmpR family regulator
MSARRVLCVHQKPKQLETLRGVLEEDGYDVLPAADGIKALDVLSHQDVDGVIIGYDIEGPGGVTLRTRIQHQCPDVPILMVDEVQNVTRISLQMFGAYLKHPAPPEAVFAHLKN